MKIFWIIATSRPPNVPKPLVSAVEDSLPPFATLTSDEDRERKAEGSNPGTYHVVVIPASFACLPEYAHRLTDELKSRGHEGNHSPINESLTNSEMQKEDDISVEVADSNVVIVKRFEDTTRRSCSSGRSSRLWPDSDIRGSFSPATSTTQYTPRSTIEEEYFPAMSDNHEPAEDILLLIHFRTVVWRQLVPVEYGAGQSPALETDSLGPDVFEREATNFPPVREGHSLLSLQFGAGHSRRLLTR